jgi:ubiquinone/menaquinone biosynthesis C-methylase UbiE
VSDLFVQRIREREIDLVLPYFPERAGARVLDLGAGAGWQSAALNRHGFAVTAFDVDPRPAWGEHAWDVALYDGHHLPVPDGSFDVVFSSNVLEHVPHVGDLLRELARVLTDGGRAIHVLPSPAWRAWTSAAHYPWLAKKIVTRLVRPAASPSTVAAPPPMASTRGARRVLSMLQNNLIPHRHGEQGNVLTELAWFSRTRWERLFQSTGWRVDAYVPGDLFYTGCDLFSHALGLGARERLSRILGGATHTFVLSKLSCGAERRGTSPPRHT